ncbi:MAG: vitamin B12-dependent ribonucleotide reductase, partial [Terriglobia bacterium]
MAERDAVTLATVATSSTKENATKRGITMRRLFTKPGIQPFDEVEWEMRTASIQNEKGQAIFEQRNVEVPADWSQTAANIVASKYFHGKLGTPERESSVRQLISRVADTIAQWGVDDSYFRTEEDAANFHD